MSPIGNHHQYEPREKHELAARTVRALHHLVNQDSISAARHSQKLRLRCRCRVPESSPASVSHVIGIICVKLVIMPPCQSHPANSSWDHHGQPLIGHVHSLHHDHPASVVITVSRTKATFRIPRSSFSSNSVTTRQVLSPGWSMRRSATQI